MTVKRKLKKSVKIGLIAFIALVVIIITAIVLIDKDKKHKAYLASYEYKLSEKGYNEDEVKYLLEQSDELKDKILDLDYNAKIIDFTKEKYFILNNLESYVDYYSKNLNTKVSDIISTVNVGANNNFYENVSVSKTSDNNLILVNKYNHLPDNYTPENLVDVKNWYAYGENKMVEEAYEKFVDMFKAAEKENLKIIILSAYRSNQEQEETYKSYVSRNGAKVADTIAARPGYSEHETGLAIDVTTGNATKDTFEQTDEFKWLVENSYKYGYILRYPKDKEKITGFDYESWHFRYVGIETAKKIHDLDITFDEYYAFYVANQ